MVVIRYFSALALILMGGYIQADTSTYQQQLSNWCGKVIHQIKTGNNATIERALDREAHKKACMFKESISPQLLSLSQEERRYVSKLFLQLAEDLKKTESSQEITQLIMQVYVETHLAFKKKLKKTDSYYGKIVDIIDTAYASLPELQYQESNAFEREKQKRADAFYEIMGNTRITIKEKVKAVDKWQHDNQYLMSLGSEMPMTSHWINSTSRLLFHYAFILQNNNCSNNRNYDELLNDVKKYEQKINRIKINDHLSKEYLIRISQIRRDFELKLEDILGFSQSEVDESWNVLGVNENITEDELSKKRKELMRANHPDKRGQGLTELSQNINGSFDTLKKFIQIRTEGHLSRPEIIQSRLILEKAISSCQKHFDHCNEIKNEWGKNRSLPLLSNHVESTPNIFSYLGGYVSSAYNRP